MPEPYERPTKIQFQGKMVDAFEVEFTSLREDWNIYQVADGSKIRAKTVVSNIYRVPGVYDAQGNPLYVITSGNVVSAESPDRLKKPSP